MLIEAAEIFLDSSRRVHANTSVKMVHSRWLDMAYIGFSLFKTSLWSGQQPENVTDGESYLFYLAEDLAHGGQNASLRKKAKGLLKGLTALEAMLLGMIGGPILRHSARIDFSCYGPATSYSPSMSFQQQLEAAKDSPNKLEYLHKEMNQPLLLDVKSSIAGNNSGGVKSVLEQLQAPNQPNPGVVVLLDACWFSQDEIKELQEKAGDACNRLFVFEGCMTFQFLQNVLDNIVST
jgi:hypothetical protein